MTPTPALVGTSPQIRELKRQIAQVAAADFPVLITGESGTGKELVARAIHAQSSRRSAPFVGQSCLAIPETLIESELFGHEQGAFTDARERRVGLFEQAEGGTLLLDEVGEIPLSFQKRLLRVLQEREVRRLGATTAVAIDVRIITATNAPLAQMVEQGTFRLDLLHRLNTFELQVPPLRHRPEDIPHLAEHFAQRHAERFHIEPRVPSPEVMRRMREYTWPGNARELDNFMVRWLSLGDEALDGLNRESGATAPGADISRRWRSMTLDEIEAEVIRVVLNDCRNNKTVAAKRLGLSRKSLYNMMVRFHIDVPTYSRKRTTSKAATPAR